MKIQKFQYHDKNREVAVLKEDNSYIAGFDFSHLPEGKEKDKFRSALAEAKTEEEVRKINLPLNCYRRFNKSEMVKIKENIQEKDQ